MFKVVGGAGRDKVLDLEEKVEKEVVGKKVEVDKEQVDMNKKDVQGVRPGGRCGRGRRHFLLSSCQQRQVVTLSPTD